MRSSLTETLSGGLPSDSGRGSVSRPGWNELRAWIDSLTPAGRLIFLLHFGDGLAAGDVAELVGLAEVTVAQQLGAFRRRARAILAGAEVSHERR